MSAPVESLPSNEFPTSEKQGTPENERSPESFSVDSAPAKPSSDASVGNECSPRPDEEMPSPIPLRNRCSSEPANSFAVAARALWPRKTAAELALRAHVSERAAKFWLSGDREPSVDAILAIVDEIRGHQHK